MAKKSLEKKTKKVNNESQADSRSSGEVKTVAPITSGPSFVLPVIISLIVGIGLGAGIMLMQNKEDKDLAYDTYMRNMEESQREVEKVDPEVTELVEVTETEVPSPTATATATVKPTQTAKPTPTTVSKSITLVDPVGGNSFKYTFQVSSSDTVKKAADSTSFSVKFAKGGEFFVQQRYEAYNNEYDGFNQVSGKLGSYYRITYPGSPNAYFYVDSLNTQVTCDSFDGTIMPPCGAGVYADPTMNYLGEFSCNANVAVCDSTMATMDVVKL